MRKRLVHQVALITFLLSQFLTCLAAEPSKSNQSLKYLNAVREFADNVLKYGRDTYGPKHTPLFVDGINIHTQESAKESQKVEQPVKNADELNRELIEAIMQGQQGRAEELIVRGADINARGNQLLAPLHYAVAAGNNEIVSLLLAHGAAIDAKDDSDRTLLHYAVGATVPNVPKGHNSGVVKLLLNKDFDVNAVDKVGFTPLCYAIREGYEDLVRLLIDQGADVDLMSQGNTPLFYAVWKHDNITKLLLDHGAQVNVKNSTGLSAFEVVVRLGNRELVDVFISKGADISTFHMTAAMGDIRGVNSFLEKGVPVDTRDEYGWTPLFWAIRMGQIEMVELLIAQGADVNLKTEDQLIPLQQAVRVGLVNIVQLLITNGADVNARCGGSMTSLHFAVIDGHKEVAEVLIASGADMNAKSNQKLTPLNFAIRRGDAEFVKLLINNNSNVNVAFISAARQADKKSIEQLLDFGADINYQDDSGLSALDYAVIEEDVSVVQFLLEHGADVDVRDNAKLMPLHYAAGAELRRIQIHAWNPSESKRNAEIVEFLIKQGLDVNAQDGYGLTSLHYATVNNRANTMLLLLNNGARLDVRDNAGRVPLHYATGAGPGFNLPDNWSVEIARLLLDRGADVNVRDNIGWTPLQYLVQSRSKVGIEFIVEKGANLDCVDNRGCTPYLWAHAAASYHESVSGPQFRHSGADEFHEIVELLRKIGNCGAVDPNSQGINRGTFEITTKAISDGVCFVATNGQDTNPGTLKLPLRTLSAAVTIAKPNDVILIRGGVYRCSEAIHFDKSGEPGKPIVVKAYARENPVFDFSDAKDDSSYGSLVITGAYWHLKGLAVTKAPHFGVRIYGNNAHHNILEQIQAYENVSTGIALARGLAYNTILNCDAYLNFDHNWNGEDSCGFEVCWDAGPGNIFIGNRSWNCGDTLYGWWMAGESIRSEKCFAWQTTENIWNHPFYTGNGRGFSLGHSLGQEKEGHLLISCAAWNQHFAGFSLNNHKSGAALRNCTALKNITNYCFDVEAWDKKGREGCIFSNNISHDALKRDRINSNADSRHNSWDVNLGLKLTDGDFLSLDDSVMSAPRNPDGSIPQNDFLKLAPGSAAIDKGVDVGMLFVGPRPDLGAFEYDPNQASEGYVKMLHQAVRDHDEKEVNKLLTAGQGINDKDWLGYTPLHWAVYFGYSDFIELLISKGANPDIQSDTGRYALEIARAMAYPEIEALLRKLGAKAGDVSTDEDLQEPKAAEEQNAKKEKTEKKGADEEQQTEEKSADQDKPSSESPDILAAAQFYFPNPCPPLGGNVVTHKETIPKSKSAKPGYMETFVDPYFGSKITRVSGDKGQPIPVIGGTWPEHCRNHYQKDPPWNADGSVLYLCKGCKMFLDGHTYEPLDLKTPPGPPRFHPLKPDIMIVLPRRGNRIEQFNLRTGTSEILATFPGYSGLSYLSEGNISGNGRWIAPYAVKGGKKVTFAYDMEEKKKYPDIDLTGWDIDWVSICFSGKYVVVNGKATQNDITQIYESTTGRKVGPRWSRYGHPSHYDLGIDQNGDDVAVGVAKSNPNRGRCIMRRLKDGKEKALCPAGSHTGTRNTHRPGWAYIQNTHKDPYVDEVIAVELIWDAEPVVERLAYIPNVKVDYLSETHGAVSFDGKKFCAVSNWGLPGGQVQAYVVNMTDLCNPSVDGNRN